MGYGKTDIHEFYCLNCGNRGLDCVRPQAHRRERFHRKKLYCPTCRLIVNHVECKNPYEVENFKILFKDNYFAEEARLSIEECN